MSYLYSTYRLISSRNASISFINSAFNNLMRKNGRRGFAIAATAAASINKKEIRLEPCSRYSKQFPSILKVNQASISTNSKKQPLIMQQLTKNLTLCSDVPRVLEKDRNTLKLKKPVDKPLVIILAWLLAPKKHLKKYAQIYVDEGFDVLIVEITPWQLLWPTKGTQVVAADVVKFLDNNMGYTSFVLHGFSIGGYLWGECMVHMSKDLQRYEPLLNKITAQIWDSAADITEISIGVPKAIFPKNLMLQNALKNYCIYHMKTFHEQATQHYIRSSQIFHSTLVKAPALFLLSRNDPVGSEKSNKAVKDSYESLGINCTWKCWERSGHIQHFRNYKDEYLEYLYKHLEHNSLEKISKKSRAKL